MIDERGTPLDESLELIVKEANENKTELIYISANSYFKIQPLISMYRKIGYKFINPSTVFGDYLK